MYRECWSHAAHAVLWTRLVRPDATDLRVLPDGCLDLIWLDGRLIVAGPDTTAQVGEDRPGARYVGLRFPPGTGPALLGCPAHELRDRRVPLDALWPAPLVRRLAERIVEAPDVVGAVESVAAGRPTVPIETYLRLMYLKHRYGLGYETLSVAPPALPLIKWLIRQVSTAQARAAADAALAARSAELALDILRFALAEAVDLTLLDPDARLPAGRRSGSLKL